MIDLYEVKKWRTYDFIQDTLPASDGTWLCSLTAGPYTRGHSYQVTSGTATRIEANDDMLIEAKIHPTIDAVCGWLNNYFYVSRALQDTTYNHRYDDDWYVPIALTRQASYYQSDVSSYTFASGVVTGLAGDIFAVGDLVTFRGALRNNIVGYVTAVSSGSITIDNPNTKDTTENAVIFLSDIPIAVEQVIQQMIEWDVFERQVSDKKSETIGNYSYDNGDATIGGISYPSVYTTQLNIWRKAEIVS